MHQVAGGFARYSTDQRWLLNVPRPAETVATELGISTELMRERVDRARALVY